MSLLQLKKKHNQLSGKFTYVIKNAVVFNRARNRWMLRIPAEILKILALRIGGRVDAKIKGKSLLITKLNRRKRNLR